MTRVVWCVFLASAFGGGATAARPATADVVWLDDGQVLYGLVDREDPEHLFFRQRLEEPGRYLERTIRRDRVRAFVITVDRARLELMVPGQWSDWRDRAEELAVQHADPECRDLALRLFLTVARHATGELQAAGFRGALQVTGGWQQRRIRALAFQTTGDASWLDGGVGDDAVPADFGGRNPDRIRELLLATRAMRRGDRQSATRIVKEADFDGRVQALAAVCTAEQFRRLVQSAEWNYADWSRVLRLEATLEEWLAENTPPPAVAADSAWSVLATQPRFSARLVTFENVTRFDLREVRYRDGKWHRAE